MGISTLQSAAAMAVARHSRQTDEQMPNASLLREASYLGLCNYTNCEAVGGSRGQGPVVVPLQTPAPASPLMIAS